MSAARVRRAALLGAGREVPGWSLRAALGVLLLALALVHAGDAWGWIAAVITIGAVTSPWPQLAWAAMASLALSELSEPGGARVWHPYVMLAGIVLAHVIATRVAVTPLRAQFALGVFARPLVVAAVVAAASEALLAVTQWLRATPHGAWLPAVAIGAVALLALGVLLFARLLRRVD